MTTACDDTERFEVFVGEVEPVLRRALVSAYGHEVGHEACADALAYAWSHWRSVEGLRSPIGYLFRVGQSASRAYRRAPLFMSPSIDLEPWHEPGLLSALAQLSARQRTVVVLVDGYAMTLSEVAEMLGVRRTTVQNHLERARGKLRKQLLRGDEQ